MTARPTDTSRWWVATELDPPYVWRIITGKWPTPISRLPVALLHARSMSAASCTFPAAGCASTSIPHLHQAIGRQVHRVDGRPAPRPGAQDVFHRLRGRPQVVATRNATWPKCCSSICGASGSPATTSAPPPSEPPSDASKLKWYSPRPAVRSDRPACATESARSKRSSCGWPTSSPAPTASCSEREAGVIKSIQDELHRHLRPVPIDEPTQHDEAERRQPAGHRVDQRRCQRTSTRLHGERRSGCA